MKTATTTTIGLVALLVAIMCGVVNFNTERRSEDRHNPQVRPMRTMSTLGEERRSKKPREHMHNPEFEFQRHLSKIEPITAFNEPSDGCFHAYLLTRNAESLLNQGEQSNIKGTVLEQLEKSYAYFLGVRETAPDWKVQMVLARLEKPKSSLREAYFASNPQNRTQAVVRVIAHGSTCGGLHLWVFPDLRSTGSGDGRGGLPGMVVFKKW